jgi:hypothetical protein
MLSNPIGIRLVLLALVVMPVTELVLPLDVDGHWINPTTQVHILQVQQHDASKNLQRPQQQVPLTLTPVVLKRLLNNAKGLDQRWGSSTDQSLPQNHQPLEPTELPNTNQEHDDEGVGQWCSRGSRSGLCFPASWS